MSKKQYTSKELAYEILEQASHAGTLAGNLKPEDFAPVEEVQKWLDAGRNYGEPEWGNAEEISREIYKLLENPKITAWFE